MGMHHDIRRFKKYHDTLEKCPMKDKCAGYIGGTWCIHPDFWTQCENQKLLRREMEKNE